MKQFNRMLSALLLLCLSVAVSAQDCSTNASFGSLSSGSVASQNGVALTARGVNVLDSVWYSFTVPANGFFSISSAQQATKFDTLDTRVYLYESNAACANLVLIATSDDDAGLFSVLNNIEVKASKTYYILWDNKSFVKPLNFGFDYVFVSGADFITAANNDMCNATVLSDGNLVSASNRYAGIQGQNEYNYKLPILNGEVFGKKSWNIDRNIHNSVWFKFIASDTAGSVVIDANFDVQCALFTTSNCGDFSKLSLVEARDDQALNNRMYNEFNYFCLVPGNTYYVLVDGYGIERGDFDISYSTNTEVVFPLTVTLTNDTVRNAAGAYCPGENVFGLTGVVKDANGNVVSGVNAFNYVNQLTAVLTRNGSVDASFSMSAAYSAVKKAGVYQLTFTDECGRVFTSNSLDLKDTLINTLALSVVNTTKPGCALGTDGSLEFSVTGGYLFVNDANAINGLKYSYKKGLVSATYAQVEASAAMQVGNNTSWFTNLSAGKYSVTATDACGKTSTVQFEIVDPSRVNFTISTLFSKNPYCPTTATGEFAVKSIGGQNKPTEYEFSVRTATNPDVYAVVANSNNDTLTNLSSGTYYVAAFDGCDQRDTIRFTLVEPAVSPLSYTVSVVNPTSFTSKNGAINLTVAGGKPGYTVKWTVDGTVRNDLNGLVSLTNIGQGIYHVNITDTCATSGLIDTTFVVLTPILNDSVCNALAITANDSLVAYHNNGATADANPSLAVPQRNDEGYMGWSETSITKGVWFKFTAPSSGAVSLSAKHYQVLSNNNFDPQIAVYSATACDNAGSFTLLAANDNDYHNVGNPSIVNDSYLEVTCLTPGSTYYVLVDGYQGIGETGIFYLNLKNLTVNPLTVARTVTQGSACLSQKGTVIVNKVLGGIYTTSPEVSLYTYSFNNTTGTLAIDELTGDITEVNGIPTAGLLFDNLDNGTYPLIISDVCGVKYTESIVISQVLNSPILINSVVSDANCDNSNDGAAVLTFTGGGTSSNFTYGITGPNGYNTTASYNAAAVTLSNLTVGVYTVNVADNCLNPNQKSFVFEVKDKAFGPFMANVAASNPACIGGDGKLIISSTAGVNKFYYTIKSGLTLGTATATGLGNAGLITGADTVVAPLNAALENYYVEITSLCDYADNAASISQTATVRVQNPVYSTIVLNEKLVNPSDSGLSDGSIAFKVAGGVPSYTVVAERVNSNLSVTPLTITNDTIKGLRAGTYRIRVQDFCGVNQMFTLVLNNPPTNDDACAARAILTGVSYTFSNVGASIQAGESAIAPSVSDSCTSNKGWCLNQGLFASTWFKFTAVESGSYTISTTSGNFDPQVAAYKVEDCNAFTTASYTLLAANDDQAANTTASKALVTCLKAGDVVYVLVVAADSLYGSFDINVSLSATEALTIFDNATPATSQETATGAINIEVVGGAKPYAFVWSNGSVKEDINNLITGSYTVVVTDACGTTKSKTVFVDFLNLNAGADTAKLVCQNYASFDLASLLAANVTLGGKFIDSTNATVSAVITPGNYDLGANKFRYAVSKINGVGDTIRDTALITINIDLCSSVKEIAGTNYFSVYPNPNNGSFTLQNNGDTKAFKATIYDVTGKVVYTDSVSLTSNSSKAISLDGIAKGVYTLTLSTNNGVEYHRFIVE